MIGASAVGLVWGWLFAWRSPGAVGVRSVVVALGVLALQALEVAWLTSRASIWSLSIGWAIGLLLHHTFVASLAQRVRSSHIPDWR